MNPMKFSEMSYTRPDIDALLGQCKALAAKVRELCGNYGLEIDPEKPIVL